MNHKSFLHPLLSGAAIAAGVFLLIFVVACSWIGYEVKRTCRDARQEYAGDCVEALVQVVSDESQSYPRRNAAVWSLGQLGDARALPVLKQYFTGIMPEREPLDTVMSQYELRKAIALAEGGVNITAPFWRSGFLSQ